MKAWRDLPQKAFIFRKRSCLLAVIFIRRLSLKNILVIVSRKFVCYRVTDLIESCVLYIFKVYFLELYLKKFIRIFLYNNDFIFNLFRILFIYLFSLLISFTYLSDIYQI